MPASERLVAAGNAAGVQSKHKQCGAALQQNLAFGGLHPKLRAGGIGMTVPPSNYSRLTFTLGIAAAALAWSAVAWRYFRTGVFDFAIVAAGFFCFALALSARSRGISRGPGDTAP